MELRHLRYFLVVAEELHFARAAARLGIEQSPLSRQIQDLEADLKLRLFNRTRRATTLTKAGERFIGDARRILADVDQSVRSLRAYAATGQPVRLGLAEGLAGPPFGRLLQLCRAAEPEIAIVLAEQPLADLVAMTLSGGLDAILGPRPTASTDLDSVPAWSERLSVVTPSDDRGSGAIWLRSLDGRPWIVPDGQALPGSAREIEAVLASKALTQRAGVAATPATLMRLVAAGAGIGLLPNSLVRVMDGVIIRPLRDPDAVSTTWLTTRKDEASPVMKRFYELVKQADQDDQPPEAA